MNTIQNYIANCKCTLLQKRFRFSLRQKGYSVRQLLLVTAAHNMLDGAVEKYPSQEMQNRQIGYGKKVFLNDHIMCRGILHLTKESRGYERSHPHHEGKTSRWLVLG